jgi:hypothetical protein
MWLFTGRATRKDRENRKEHHSALLLSYGGHFVAYEIVPPTRFALATSRLVIEVSPNPYHCLVRSTGLEPAIPTLKVWWLNLFAYKRKITAEQSWVAYKRPCGRLIGFESIIH